MAAVSTLPAEKRSPWADPITDADIRLFGMRLLGERFAFDASLALEVIRLGPLTRLPAAPSFLPGVFNHRGEVLAVFDPAAFLGEQSTSIAHGCRAVIVQCGRWRLALIAEVLEGLIAVKDGQIDEAPTGGEGPAAYLQSVARTGAGLVAVLDLPRLIEAARGQGVAR